MSVEALSERVSDGEARFEARRRAVGRVAAPLVLGLLLLFPPAALHPEAARLLALVAATLVAWLTEALPIPVTALLAPALGVALGVAPAKTMFAPMADPILYLFVGAFFIAEAIERTGADRLAAERLFARAAGNPVRLVLVACLATAGLSTLLSNTATTAMMLPILRAALPGASPRFLSLAYLSTAFCASIGGVATPVGSPPNLIALGQLRTIGHIEVTFLDWVLVALPVMAVLLAFWLLWVRRFTTGGPKVAAAPRLAPVDPDASLGRLLTVVVFGLTAALWVAPGVVALVAGPTSKAYLTLGRHLPEGVVALLGASLLFVLPRGRGGGTWRPILTWAEAKGIDWGTVILFGGGLCLGEQAFATGLSDWAGRGIVEATGVSTVLGLAWLFSVTTIVLTELTSNTATAAMLCPLSVMASLQAGVSPVAPCIATALGASMAFLLPISTGPNALVYGTGLVPLRLMARHGLALDAVGAVVIAPLVVAMVALLGLG